ncbi:hypothetical protein HK100_002311 [Physocladia obscura]|uniref:Heterokaryon incompatibility domain-containing protein n=1 Tax=Physocladia obscura TaxID=109957 RepID=A0AAD5XDX7_9FUNG|nr:hypothetical protein HK100_002311 [Physocladia obscura]
MLGTLANQLESFEANQSAQFSTCTEIGGKVFIRGPPSGKYDTISHVWGLVNEINVDGIPLLLNSNIQKRHILFSPSVLEPQAPIWMDVISIDQHDQDHKAAQVSVMHLIYAQAARTHVIIEDNGAFCTQIDHVVQTVSEVIREFNETAAIDVTGIFRICKILDTLMAGTEYMGRAWTAQEFVLSCNKRFYCLDSTNIIWSVFTANHFTSLLNTLCTYELRLSGPAQAFFSGYVSALAASVTCLFGSTALKQLLKAVSVQFPNVIEAYTKAAETTVTGSTLLDDSSGWLDLVAHRFPARDLTECWNDYDLDNQAVSQRGYLLVATNSFECGGHTYSLNIGWEAAIGNAPRTASVTKDYWWAVARLIGLVIDWDYNMDVQTQMNKWIVLLISRGWYNLAEWGHVSCPVNCWAYEYNISDSNDERTKFAMRELRERIISTRKDPWIRSLPLQWNRDLEVFEIVFPREIGRRRHEFLQVKVDDWVVLFGGNTKLHVVSVTKDGMFADIDISEVSDMPEIECMPYAIQGGE